MTFGKKFVLDAEWADELRECLELLRDNPTPLEAKFGNNAYKTLSLLNKWIEELSDCEGLD